MSQYDNPNVCPKCGGGATSGFVDCGISSGAIGALRTTTGDHGGDRWLRIVITGGVGSSPIWSPP